MKQCGRQGGWHQCGDPLDVRVAPSGTRSYYLRSSQVLVSCSAMRLAGRMPTTCRRRSGGRWRLKRRDLVIDRAGQEATYCCINAVLRDYARWDCFSPTTGTGAADRSSLRPGSRTPRVWGQVSRSPVPVATAIRSGYCRASGGCSRSVASVASRSMSIGEPPCHGPHGSPETGPRSGRPRGDRAMAEPRAGAG